MACMCGDICCWSCGPAQGNTRCPICRAWASDGCEHVQDFCLDPRHETPCPQPCDACEAECHGPFESRLKPEFEADAERVLAEEADAEHRLCEETERLDQLADARERAGEV